jgi:SAM-dependent methyltransferase
MRPGLEKELICIECGGELRLEPFRSECGPLDRLEILDGCLECGCGAIFPIIAGVPRLVAGEFARTWPARYPCFFEEYGARVTGRGSRVGGRDWCRENAVPGRSGVSREGGLATRDPRPATEVEARTAQSFAYEWERFGALRPEWEANFWRYMSPLSAADLAGQRVLDAGCGSGRHAYHAGRAGATVFAVDLGESVDVAYRNTTGLANVHVVQADLRRLPFRGETFDRVYSLGVLHHLPDPYTAFRGLLPYLRAGGEIRVYLYWALEDAPAWQRTLLDGVTMTRRITTRLPHPLLHLLSYPIAAAAFGCFVIPNRVLSRWERTHALAEKLPLGQYAGYPFRVCVNDQFDRFSAPIERRYTRAEVLSWMKGAGLESPEVRAHFGWIGTARRTPSEAGPASRQEPVPAPERALAEA